MCRECDLTVENQYGTNPKDFRKENFPAQGVVVREKKTVKKFLLASCPTQKWVPQKNIAKINCFLPLPPPPFCRNARIAGGMLCWPHCLLPRFRVSCPILHLSENDESETKVCTVSCSSNKMIQPQSPTRKKKTQKIIFGTTPYAKTGSAKKARKK